MKSKFLLPLSILCSSLPVYAESSVTLYGVLDSGIHYVSNQNSNGDQASAKLKLKGGNWFGNRWGLRGSEDLGNGTIATFVLENGFGIFNGQAEPHKSQMFGREATVGFANERLGMLTFGRQYDSFADYLGIYSAANDWATGIGAHFGDIDNINSSIRINNSIKYQSASLNGFRFGGLYSLDGISGHFTRNQVWSAAASYAHGPFSIGAGYSDIKNPLVGSIDNPQASPYSTIDNAYEGGLPKVYGNLQVASSMHVMGLGGSYKIDDVILKAVISRSKLKDSQYFALNNIGTTNSDVRFDNFEVSIKYLASPALNVGAAYTFTNGKTDYLNLNPRFHQINIGSNYAISKRTAIYLAAGFQKAAGDGLAVDSNGNFRKFAGLSGNNASSSDRQFVLTTGIKHSF